MIQPKSVSILNLALYLIFFASVICSFRAVTSISIGLILLTGLLTNRAAISFSRKRPDVLFIAGCTLFFLLQFVSLLYTGNEKETWDHIRLKSGLAITPIAFYYSGYLNSKTIGKSGFYFCVLLAIASAYCIITAIGAYIHSADTSLFFYHQLVSPLKQHAVYFSIYVFFALVCLFETLKNRALSVNRPVYILLIIYFSVLLFLLSSKLVLGFYVLYAIIYFIRSFQHSGNRKWISIGLLVLVAVALTISLGTKNRVSNRFLEIAKGDLALVNQDRFHPSDSFNGLQFRLLQWRFVPEILNENRAWLAGMSNGDAQMSLDKKYLAKNMYTGEVYRQDRGFLGYNTHSQFLESLLQQGIIGTVLFLFICFCLLRMAWRSGNSGVVFIISLVLAYGFTESVFETQYGIILFTFFPLWIYWANQAGPKAAGGR